MSADAVDMAWAALRLVAVPALLMVLVRQLVVHQGWREPFRLALLVLVPVLITLWFMHDGGLRNPLNRMAYYVSTGLFFAGYAALMAGALVVQRLRGRPPSGHGRALCCAGLALLAWACATTAYENLG